ncbi:DUF2303 family protein [Niveispirillum sp.]|uniref:DUF2303 family protein n=1 Tax=Niveispirillum sp. TaxID=1917217 RepID=UPI001B798FB3|nr:DUF2303 family protein [Niveispirillum sp.]MBP7336906.1 DUF2303 family protein [Niveispirillum sp.]
MNPTPADMTALINAVKEMHGNNELIPAIPAVPGSTTLLVMPEKRDVQDLGAFLDKYLPRPRFLAESALLGGTDAMITYAQRFKTNDSILFVDPNPDAPWLKLVVDYHAVGTILDGDDVTPDERLPPAPAHCRHTATYKFPLSDEMQAWRGAAKAGLMDQEAFAWLLQQRQNDISNPPANWMLVREEEVDRICALLNLRDDHQPTDKDGRPIALEDLDLQREEGELPTGYRTRQQKLETKRFGTQQQLLTLSTEMSVRTSASSKQQIRLQDGTHFLEFSEDHEAQVKGQKVKVPELFLIDIPVFDGEPSHLMPVRLYYRRAGGGIKWMVELVDHRRMLKDAIIKAATDVSTATDLTLISGNPFAKAA